MIAVDTNLLVYAHRAGTAEHGRAQAALERAAGAPGGWGIALASVVEFWSVVTHPSCQGGPSTPAQAAAFLEALTRSGRAQLWQPAPGFAARLTQLAADLGVSGPRVFDLQIGLTATDNGATELWTHDARFTRIPGLRLADPL